MEIHVPPGTVVLEVHRDLFGGNGSLNCPYPGLITLNHILAKICNPIQPLHTTLRRSIDKGTRKEPKMDEDELIMWNSSNLLSEKVIRIR